jgi:hypothetical protein
MDFHYKLVLMRRFFLLFTLFLWGNTLFSANQPIFINDRQSPTITEFMASNNSMVQDNKGRYPDWVELYNPTQNTINLSGWFLSDNEARLHKWRFPETMLMPGQYKVVYLSGDNDVTDPMYLHASFSLKAEGEPLILTKPDGTTKAWYFDGAYPAQYTDVSYGLVGNEYKYLVSPTPGKANAGEFFLPPLFFSKPNGYYNNAFALEINSNESNVTVYYSLNGSVPDSVNGIKYVSPLTISKTSVVRAVGYKKGYRRSTSATSSFLFTTDVLKQPAAPPGYPLEWGPYIEMSGNAIADYEMDPEICNNPVYASRIEGALKELPVLSIVADIGHLFSSSEDPENGGIYYYSGAPIGNTTYALGKEWERPASVQYFEPGGNGFSIDCGIKINGGHSRRNEKSPKHSFRLLFKNEYGGSRLNYDIFNEEGAVTSFSRLVLRAGYNNTWTHSDANQRKKSQYILDSWAKDTYKAMGNVAAHNKFVHLYLNGLYWGLYNISERMDEHFMESYFEGEADDFDVIKDYTELASGDMAAWNELNKAISASGLSTESYQKLIGNNPDGSPNPATAKLIDAQNLIDYMLLNFYAGNSDWDHHNWVSARNRNNPEGFKFLPWDSEVVFMGVNNDVTNKNNRNCPSGVFQGLLKNSDFKTLLADRIYLHFFNNGLLTPQRVAEVYMGRADEVRNSMICESARWGDYRRDVHSWGSSPFELYTIDHWELALDDLLDNYFPKRTEVVISQLKKAGYYPLLDAPEIDKTNTVIAKGDKVFIGSTATEVYYTLDGSDPRLPGGGLSSTAIRYSKTNGATIHNTSIVTARAKSGDQWSAMDQAAFSVTWPVNTDGLAMNGSNDQFIAFPNPAKNNVLFQFYNNGAGNGQIEIYSVLGKHIATIKPDATSMGITQVEYDVSVLAKGVYVCLLKSDKTALSIKLVVAD